DRVACEVEPLEGALSHVDRVQHFGFFVDRDRPGDRVGPGEFEAGFELMDRARLGRGGEQKHREDCGEREGDPHEPAVTAPPAPHRLEVTAPNPGMLTRPTEPPPCLYHSLSPHI